MSGPKPGTAAAMRAYWDDPNWRARQVGLIAAARKSKSPPKTPKTHLVSTTVGLDPTVYRTLRTLAANRLTSVPEIIRTYIQWGLDTDGVDDE